MQTAKVPDPQPELRRRFRAYLRARRKWESESGGLFPGHPQYRRPPACPPNSSELRCGATTRKGTPCKRKDIGAGGRCRLHGGMSTGPRTKKGKQRSAKNAKRTPCGHDKT